MVRYRRNFIAGGTYFFTVTLADRTSSVLVDHVSALRMAFRIARHERPFTIDAIVILPEHLHAIWTRDALRLSHQRTPCSAHCRASGNPGPLALWSLGPRFRGDERQRERVPPALLGTHHSE